MDAYNSATPTTTDPAQPQSTGRTFVNNESCDFSDPTPILLSQFAQQAVLPRKLDEGYYATLDADGAIQIIETPGHKDQRTRHWEDANAEQPRFIERTVTVQDVPSFLAYLSRYTINPVPAEGELVPAVGTLYRISVGALELWANQESRVITGILDGLEGHGRHKARLHLGLTPEWREWANIDGKLLPQVEFAEFIEDHISTIAEPDGAQLLDICQTLTGHTDAQFKQQQVLSNGQRAFRWEETVDARAGQNGELLIPGELTIVMRPFEGDFDPVAVKARFRFRITSGGLTLGVKLIEPQRALDQAWDGVLRSVQAGVSVPVYRGSF